MNNLCDFFLTCEFLKMIENIILKAVPLIISTFVGTWIVRKAFLPRVDIKAKREHILNDNDGCFLSLNIVNVGPNVAQNCCAYIILDTDVNKDDLLNPNEADTEEHLPNYKEEKPNFEIPREALITREKVRSVMQIQLCWTHHGNPYEKNLNPGVQAQLDICRYQISKTSPSLRYIIFPTERGWRRIHFRLRYQSLSGKLYICPANSFPNIFNIFFYLDECGAPSVVIKKKRTWGPFRTKLLLH